MWLLGYPGYRPGLLGHHLCNGPWTDDRADAHTLLGIPIRSLRLHPPRASIPRASIPRASIPPRVTRVLLVHQPTDGGVARHVRDLANGLGERGYEVTLCGPRAPEGVVESVDWRGLNLQRAVAPRPDLTAVATLAQVVRELRPDIVHAHSSKAGAVARLARVFHPRIPLLYSPHLYAFAGYFERSTERRAYRVAERLLAPATSRVVCVCEAEARLARAIGPPTRVRVIYNGIEPVGEGPIDPRLAELSGGGPVVGALALLHRRKGLETLIDATPRMLDRHPRAQLAIVGEGPELETLRARARRRNVAHAVCFLGPSEDPLSTVRGMDVFVLPSWAESFPYVILEAMSLGRPIVASNVGGVREAVVDGESGLLVPPRDEHALAIALTDLLDDPGRAARMGESAQRRASRQFTLTAMTDGLAGVYSEVAAPPRAHRPRPVGSTP
jgi:glycosyltransferase involved in cell wall biosynthesis